MEITWARWSLEGADAILSLRSLRASADLDDWRHHEQRELERNHAARYAKVRIPSLTRPSRVQSEEPHPDPHEQAFCSGGPAPKLPPAAGGP
jgi:hypothetical protein